MKILRNNTVVAALFIALAFVNAHAIMAGWYR